MCSFDKLFCNTTPGHTPAEENEWLKDDPRAKVLLKTSTEDKCCVCHGPCTWMDMDFIVMVCSEECLDKLMYEYVKKQNTLDRKNKKWYRRLFWFLINKYLSWRYNK